MFSSVVVFMENKAGKIAEITKILAKDNINILCLNLDDSGQFGILRLVVDDYTKARDILFKNNYIVALENVIYVELEDEIGAFAEFLTILDNEKINITQAAGSVISLGEKAIFSVMSSNPDRLISILKDHNIKIIENMTNCLAGLEAGKKIYNLDDL